MYSLLIIIVYKIRKLVCKLHLLLHIIIIIFFDEMKCYVDVNSFNDPDTNIVVID